MHRSGTSFTANWLHDMGLSVGERLLPSAPSNPNGHFEDLDFYNFHEALLEKNKLPFYVKKGDKLYLSEEDNRKAKQIVSNKSKQEQWAWKDPRTCLFIPFWANHLNQADVDVKYLMIYRPVEQVVDSLIRRDIILRKSNPNIFMRWFYLVMYKRRLKDFQSKYLQSWIYHVSKIKETHQTHPNDSLVIQVKNLAITQDKIYSTLTKKWNFNLLKLDIKEIFEAEKFQSLPEINKYSNKEIQEIHDYFISIDNS